MTEVLQLSVVSAILFSLAIIGYFKVAERYNIIDRPNERSSHVTPTIRGGGIIFIIAILGFAVLNGFNYIYFLAGFFLISLVSFIDDIRSLNNKVRLIAHFISILLLILQITNGELSWWYWPVFLVIAIGIVNAYNFMDGINGITGLYTLVMMGTLLYLHQQEQLDVPIELLILPIAAILVFNFFNVRTKARCFAGDVGSVSLAFLVIFLIGMLSWQQNQWMYIWLFGIYGADSALTIAQRLYLRQNIFKAHRLHLYQLMANEGKIPHLLVSSIYALSQLVLNYLLINYIIPSQVNPFITNGILAISFLLIYIPTKLYFHKKRITTV